MKQAIDTGPSISPFPSMRILGIPIDNLSRTEILETAVTWLTEDGFHRIATIGPEFLLLAEKHQAFRGALLAADLCIADGVGLHFPFWLAGEKLISHYPGADLLADLLQVAEKQGYGVVLMLAPRGLSSFGAIHSALLEKYPKLLVSVFDSKSYPLQATGYQLLLSNYGAPLQEIALEQLRRKPGNIRLAMGVGGAFDFLTGTIPRAPKLFRTLGLEWLWRLYQQPRRFRRIWNAVIIFPIKVLSQK